jgi:hypothetical protein
MGRLRIQTKAACSLVASGPLVLPVLLELAVSLAPLELDALPSLPLLHV